MVDRCFLLCSVRSSNRIGLEIQTCFLIMLNQSKRSFILFLIFFTLLIIFIVFESVYQIKLIFCAPSNCTTPCTLIGPSKHRLSPTSSLSVYVLTTLTLPTSRYNSILIYYTFGQVYVSLFYTYQIFNEPSRELPAFTLQQKGLLLIHHTLLIFFYQALL